jgi:hypothetical protein
MICTSRGISKNYKGPIQCYRPWGKERLNPSSAGFFIPPTDLDNTKKLYSYIPHLDLWSVKVSKAKNASFEIPAVPPDVHERIGVRMSIEAMCKRNGNSNNSCCLLNQKPEDNPSYDIKHGSNFRSFVNG